MSSADAVAGVVNGGVSFWYAQAGVPVPREPLVGGLSADVVIVGGGYTGLWTAYYLKKAAPFLRIVVLERKFCGYGASGRNGGWLYNGIAGRDRYARLHGREAAVRLQGAMHETVAEVVRVAGEEGIDADIHRGGVLEVACTPAQLARLKAFHAHEAAYGERDRELYGARETAERIRVAGAVGSTWTPHGARVNPVKLVTGPARVVEELGVVIHELTPVTEIRPKHAVTPYGTVRAPYVLRCTEGFTANLKGQRRTWLPMNSSMIVTEPLREILLRFFPSLAGVRVAHAWSGVLGVPRDWCATVTLDRATGLGWAGGYVGSGVATTNLAARTLREGPVVWITPASGYGALAAAGERGDGGTSRASEAERGGACSCKAEEGVDAERWQPTTTPLGVPPRP
ncbi:NAD(P)/FAD-dependent oxidoreductase [Streptomyces sp. NPDC002643]